MAPHPAPPRGTTRRDLHGGPRRCRGRLTGTRGIVYTIAAAALALAGTTGCEPPPPPASFTVNVAPGVTGDDADPGDGVCETAPGNGQCTLDAAVQEGNALGRADIHVDSLPGPTGQVAGDLWISGHLTLHSDMDRYADAVTGVATSIHVAPGGLLSLDTATLQAPLTVVDGTVLADRSALLGYVEVGSTGILGLVNAEVIGPYPPHDSPVRATITNRGLVWARYAFIDGLAQGAAAVDTLDDGRTELGGTWLWGPPRDEDGNTVAACTGHRPESLGYNLAAACGLNGPGDVDHITIDPDHIPVATLGCGTDVTEDVVGNTRPVDHDGDGIAACDVGPIEHGATGASPGAAPASASLRAPA